MSATFNDEDLSDSSCENWDSSDEEGIKKAVQPASRVKGLFILFYGVTV